MSDLDRVAERVDAIPRSLARQPSKQELQFMFDRLRQLVRARPVVAFYALAFPLSWVRVERVVPRIAA